ncbi:DHH family phosphoesterase [Anaeromyxobacter oryzisoli]|uniref:DHH family phosphoesterase n=1 Tax=Anaeromyxobacter oryzisoli TaxID=2925408 RepID=UPI001F570214|nr:DHH family phosphoesterase [Anaeromyxobacter sp. SG63]
MQLELLYHGNCFDGCASAALFARFFGEREGTRLSAISFRPLHHQQGDPFPADAFRADVTACVDFRFSPRLHWWFDHHASAFPKPEDRAAFERDRSGQKFWDPTAPSCTGFMARTLRERFGWRADDLADLVRWADVIDSAAFESAQAAVRLAEPALRIMTLLEASKDPSVPTRLIEAMQRRPLDEIAAEPWVATPLGPILERHRTNVDAVRANARLKDGVVEVDLGDTGIEGANKFIAYDLFPDARYTVVVTRDAKKTKISVGSNPWARETRTHDISKLCERYGGGGHPVVGAVSLGPDQLDEARRIAREIASALRTP